MGRISGDTGGVVGRPHLRMAAIHFGCHDRTVHGRGTPSPAIRAPEQPRFPAESDTAQASFSGIVGEAHAERSISNSRSIRRTIPIAIDDREILFLPAALRREFSSISATTKIGTCLLPGPIHALDLGLGRHRVQ